MPSNLGDVETIFPQTAAFLSATPRNKRMTVYPEAITLPISPEQVAEVVKIGKENKRRVVALSGGHSSIANSVGGFHGALIIDLNRLKQVDYDAETHCITFQTGNRLGDVISALDQHNRAIAHGTCPDVGIGGHPAFGGWGFASRMWGLNCDAIKSMDVVKDDGTQKTISADNDPDLFWAMRGAAPSFAIATSITYDTHPAPEFTISFKYWAYMPPEDIADAIVAFQEFADNTGLIPKELGIQFRVDRGLEAGQLLLTVAGIYFGWGQEYIETIEPALLKPLNLDVMSIVRIIDSKNEGIPFPPVDTTALFLRGYGQTISGNYYSSVARFAADVTLTGDSAAFAKAVRSSAGVTDITSAATQEARNLAYIQRVVNPGAQGTSQVLQTEEASVKMDPPEPLISFYIKSLMAPVLDQAALLSCMEYACQNYTIPLDWFIAFKLVGGRGSTIPTKPSTAFGWRDAFWLIEFNADATSSPPYPDFGYEFLDTLVGEITRNMPNARFGAYPGFLDERLENYNELYYNGNYTRLRQIKSATATNNVFVFPQCI